MYANEQTVSAIFTFFTLFSIMFAIIGIILIIALWKLFKKAGVEGWKSLIPIYNFVILFKIAGLNPLFVLGYLLATIPLIGSFLVLGLQIYLSYNLAKSFGKSEGFVVGLVLLHPIFFMILAFDKSKYVGTLFSSNLNN